MNKIPMFGEASITVDGVDFNVVRGKLGYTITLDGKYLWRCASKGSVVKVCQSFVRMGKRNLS